MTLPKRRRHSWGIIIDFGFLDSGLIGERPDAYFVTDDNRCGVCLMTRSEARRVFECPGQTEDRKVRAAGRDII